MDLAEGKKYQKRRCWSQGSLGSGINTKKKNVNHFIKKTSDSTKISSLPTSPIGQIKILLTGEVAPSGQAYEEILPSSGKMGSAAQMIFLSSVSAEI